MASTKSNIFWSNPVHLVQIPFLSVGCPVRRQWFAVTNVLQAAMKADAPLVRSKSPKNAVASMSIVKPSAGNCSISPRGSPARKCVSIVSHVVNIYVIRNVASTEHRQITSTIRACWSVRSNSTVESIHVEWHVIQETVVVVQFSTANLNHAHVAGRF